MLFLVYLQNPSGFSDLSDVKSVEIKLITSPINNIKVKLFDENGIELKVVGAFFNVPKELAQQQRTG